MKFQFLSKTRSNKRFDYRPMYYDERKERLNKKKEQFARIESGEVSDEQRKEMLRASLKGSWKRQQSAQNERNKSSMRFLLLLVGLLALGYFLLNGLDDVDTVVKKLW